MTYENEVLADQPTAYFRIANRGQEIGWPVGQKVTYEFGPPLTTGDSVTIVVDLDTRKPDRVFVNGEPAALDHPHAAEFMSRWTPPRRWKSDELERVEFGEPGAFAIYDKALTAEQIAAHYTAFTDR